MGIVLKYHWMRSNNTSIPHGILVKHASYVTELHVLPNSSPALG